MLRVAIVRSNSKFLNSLGQLRWTGDYDVSIVLIFDLIAVFSPILCYFAWRMMKYRVEVTEILSRTIEMEAESEDAAVKKVRQMYRNCDIILDASDYVETEISVKRWKKKRVLVVFRDNSLTLHPLIAHYWALANFVELDSSIYPSSG